MTKIRLTFRLIVLLLPISIIYGCEWKNEVGDMAFINGNIYTVDSLNSQVSAIVSLNGRILYAGNDNGAGSWIGPETEVVDLQGKTMIPGLIEGHGHFFNMGNAQLELDLLSVTSYEQLVDMVAEAVEESSPGEWILGRGWHQSKWDSVSGDVVKGFQTHRLLSAVSPENPVYLRHASGHAGFANAKALEIAGLNPLDKESHKAKEDPEGGEIIRDELGNPTGIFTETAMQYIVQHIPLQDETREIKAMDMAFENCLTNGITSFQDAGMNGHQIEMIKSRLKQMGLPVRLWVMLSGSDEELLNDWFMHEPEIGLGHSFLTIRAVKLYADGALGSRGAWMLEEYDDRSGHFGHELVSMEEIYQIANRGLQAGYQICTHAIGDRANHEVLNVYERVFSENPGISQDVRFRIEHAQHLDEQDIPRFHALNVIPAMQAIHMSSDRPWAIDRIGIDRIREGAYVWQKLLQSGAIIVNGTDVPVEPINPIASFYASVSRKTLNGTPEGGYEASQKMTRLQALQSYTIHAAYGAFEEASKGSLEVGKLADMVVLSQDIMTIPENEILDTNIDMTIVDGKIAYIRD